MNRLQTLRLAILLVVFISCQASPPTVLEPLPTMAPIKIVAANPALPSPTATPTYDPLLPTWTPSWNTLGVDSLGNVSNVNRDYVPTLTRFIPTYTPRPPATLTPRYTPTTTSTPTPGVSHIIDSLGSFNGDPAQYLPLLQRVAGTSKLGIHVVRNNDPNIMNFVRGAQPTIIKAVDDLGFLAEVKKDSPRTITIGRINVDHQSYTGTPEQAARDFVNTQLPKYRANSSIDYWEGWNEPDPNLDNMAWYARFEQERVRLLAQHGFRAAIGGFPTGVPELDEFMLFLPAIDTAILYQGILSLHEYSAPEMTYLYGGALPGQSYHADRGALTFRYRWYYEDILLPSGRLIPLAITEAGVDGIIANRPGPQGTGWFDFADYWVKQGWGSNGEEAFINQLAWYDNGTRRDPYVLGFTVFTAGGFGYWKNYDINPLLPELTHYVSSHR